MKKILVAVDFSDIAEEAIHHASAIAQGKDIELVLLHVAPPNPDYLGFKSFNKNERHELADLLHSEHTQLQALAHHLSDRNIHAKSIIVQGDTVKTIVHEAKKTHADMIVMGSHGYSGLSRIILGSVSEGVLRQATIPVLIVPIRKE